jgi:colanic acid/amylovoran biosynthesis protein
MKKVLIIPSNTDLNRGDQALVWESINLVEAIFGKENVDCSLMADLGDKDASLQNGQTEKLGYKFVDTLIKHPGRKYQTKHEDSKGYTKLTMLQWGWQAVKDYLHTRALISKFSFIRSVGEKFLSASELSTLSAIKESDAIFVKGGGFIHSYGAVTDPYFIYYLTCNMRVAQAYGKKVFVLPNSVGPLKNNNAKKIALNALGNCSLVTVRENISRQFLESLDLKAHLFPDLGFFLKPADNDFSEYLKVKGVPLEQKKVVMTLRPYRFQGFTNSDELFAHYIQGFVNLVDALSSRGYHVTFVAHTLGPSSHEDDRIAIKDVLGALPADIKKNTSYIEDFNLTCKDVEKIYSYYDYMIGTRFHSVIFSLNVVVPAIAIAYGGNKGKGIMSVLGNDEFSIDMDKVQGDSLVKFI